VCGEIGERVDAHIPWIYANIVGEPSGAGFDWSSSVCDDCPHVLRRVGCEKCRRVHTPTLGTSTFGNFSVVVIGLLWRLTPGLSARRNCLSTPIQHDVSDL